MFSFFVLPIIFEDTLSFKSASIKLFVIICLFSILSSLAMILLYISELHSKMKQSIVDNKKLLNGMHEGVLILSKGVEKSVIFCNNPVRTLLSGVIKIFEKKKLEMEF